MPKAWQRCLRLHPCRAFTFYLVQKIRRQLGYMTSEAQATGCKRYFQQLYVFAMSDKAFRPPANTCRYCISSPTSPV
jgi:hypothetical protein